MKQIISVDHFYNKLAHLPIIDVRSPGEFLQGHIPNAHNIALFNNSERSVVGTFYKKESKEKAIEIGYDFVKPKLIEFINDATEIAPQKEVVVHCWRGGMRSNAFADHLLANGFRKVYVIEKGYKSFRNYVLQCFEQPLHLKVLGGYTGTGKTEILHAIHLKGYQVIDLEELAKHRGSAFGGIDLPPQPTNEQFENNLFLTIKNLNPKLPIWVEDESQAIGKVTMPNEFFIKMRTLPVYFLNIPFAERSKHLVATYADLNAQELAKGIQRITKRLGHDKVKCALAALEHKDYNEVVTTTLLYYDKCYLRGLKKRKELAILTFEIPFVNPQKTADFLISITNLKNG